MQNQHKNIINESATWWRSYNGLSDGQGSQSDKYLHACDKIKNRINHLTLVLLEFSHRATSAHTGRSSYQYENAEKVNGGIDGRKGDEKKESRHI